MTISILLVSDLRSIKEYERIRQSEMDENTGGRWSQWVRQATGGRGFLASLGDCKLIHLLAVL
jgi:hypothetical protein